MIFSMKTKEEFHKLIDTIEDEQVLKGYFELIQKLNTQESGKLWGSLTDEQKNELIISYEESHDPEHLISHDHVKNQHDKWLKK